MKNVIGIDPGIASTGFALVQIPENIRLMERIEIGQQAKILIAGVARTKVDSKAKSKHRDRARRVDEIATKLLRLRKAAGTGKVLWVAETFTLMPGSRVTNASVSTLAIYGMVHGLAIAHGDIFLPVAPASHKSTLTGRKSSSKAEVYEVRSSDLEAAALLNPKPWPMRQNEHIGDAYSAAIYGMHEFSKIAQGYF